MKRARTMNDRRILVIGSANVDFIMEDWIPHSAGWLSGLAQRMRTRQGDGPC